MSSIEEHKEPVAHRTALVTKEGEPGALVIRVLDGMIDQPLDERPEWASGLAMALVGERLTYYSSRLTPDQFEAIKTPEAYDYDDLGWIGADEAGEAIEIAAQAEYRMEHVAKVHGFEVRDYIDDQQPESYGKGATLAEVEIGMDTQRTEDEHAAFNRSQEELRKQATG